MISLQNALEPSSSAAALEGPKVRIPASRKCVGEARHERRLGADHDQVDALVRRRGNDPVDVLGPDVDNPSVAGNARVPGGAEHLGGPRRSQQRVDERVLAAATADDQDTRR